jgi:long-chain acyl-CoA synthetase
VPADIDPSQYRSLVALMEEAFKKYADRVAYSFMGKDVSYAQTDALSRAWPPTCRAWAWSRATAWPS